MSTRTLSPAAPRPAAPRRHASRVLVVVDGTAPHPGGPASERAVPERAVPERAVPEWALLWCGRAGWELRSHPDTGPAAAAAAARLDARVLVLRPVPPAGPDRAVGDEARASSPRIVAAVRGLPDDAPVVADAAACAARGGGRLTVVHAVPRSFAGRSVGLADAVAHGRRLLDAAAERAAAQEPGLRVDRHLVRVRPHELVGEALHADLLVVGGPRTGRPGGGAGCGLVAHSALHHAPCPVLLTPR